jgi:hypothetical protein
MPLFKRQQFVLQIRMEPLAQGGKVGLGSIVRGRLASKVGIAHVDTAKARV